MYILLILLLVIAIYIFMLNPRIGKNLDFSAFENVYIAHRGFFDNEGENPENSILAFEKASERGYGIELDVQLTFDKKLVVFHDATLERMCGISKKVCECTYSELQNYKLKNSNERIPLFSEVLEVVNGKVPLIVEVKAEIKYLEVTQKTYQQIKDYNGNYCVESFHPLVVAWFKKHAPNVIRGQLSTDYFKDKPNKIFIQKFILTNLALNWIARPHFIAYNHKYANQFSYKICRKISRVKNCAWTIKNQEELMDAKKVFSILIFDSFTPQ